MINGSMKLVYSYKGTISSSVCCSMRVKNLLGAMKVVRIGSTANLTNPVQTRGSLIVFRTEAKTRRIGTKIQQSNGRRKKHLAQKDL